MRAIAADRRLPLVAAVLVAVVGWLAMWSVVTPRTGWDSLMYHRLAIEYSGASAAEAMAGAWSVFERYGPPDQVEVVGEGMRQGGSPWQAMEVPSRERWVDLYRSRPVYTLLVAIGYPVVGLVAPLLVSIGAVLVFSVALLAGLTRVIGYGAAAIAMLLSFANPLFNQWLIFLQPDGLSIALWTACLVLTALFIHRGNRLWLWMLLGAGVALSFTRPLGVFLPATIGVALTAAIIARAPEWRRLALAVGAASVGVALFAAYSYLFGLPTLTDALQDLPSRHFLRPEVDDPFTWTRRIAAAQVRDPLLPTLLGDPALWAPLLLAVAGLAAFSRGWELTPMLAAIAVVPLAYLIHPQLSEAPRTMAPIWVSVHVGLGIGVARVLALVWTGVRGRAAAGAGRSDRPAVGV